ncbi:hypothetical protein DFH08DRAFT_803226 [Mycena albidolilacea]|uniref:Uncharacterized protein n=1 Tax=Mycena albidolilacea TaxID=1033008 RepID=A0AAD7ACX8_9AGAR|nr:hypothetical protein DFH08DRAFT_803226 [Mycena albidolilacea]
MSGRLIGLFSPNVPKMPPVPSRTPAARCLACARYCEKKKEELAEKSRIKMKEYLAVLLPCYAAHISLRYCQRIQDDPVHAQEYQELKPKSALEERDAAETDADTNPKPAAGKKWKQQEEDRGKVQEGGLGKKLAGGKKAKQAEGKGKEKEKTKEKKQKGKEDSSGKKRKRGANSEQEKPPKKKKRKPFAHSTSHRSAKFVATDDDEPEGTTASDNAVAGGSSGVAGGGTGGNAVAGGSTGHCMQEKRAKDLKAAAKAKQRMEADIAADIASGKIKPKAKKKRQPNSAKEIDEDDYNNEDSS